MLRRKKRGGAGAAGLELGLFKATNKLIGEALLNQGAFWELQSWDSGADRLFTEHSVPLLHGGGVKEVKVCHGVCGAGLTGGRL